MGRVGQVEEPGLVTVSRQVVRMGDVVQTTPRSSYIAQLLTHLEQVGFGGAPRWLGQTSDGTSC